MTETNDSPEEISGNSLPDEKANAPDRPLSFWDRHKAKIGLSAVALYVFLLTLGTIGELFDVEWILDLPLFRPPGKY